MSASVAFAIIPIFFLIQKHLDVSHSDTDSGIEIVIITLCALMPIVLSTVVGSTMGRFDQLQTVGEPPVYIAVRPMTNGGFVIAKMASALAASIVTCGDGFDRLLLADAARNWKRIFKIFFPFPPWVLGKLDWRITVAGIADPFHLEKPRGWHERGLDRAGVGGSHLRGLEGGMRPGIGRRFCRVQTQRKIYADAAFLAAADLDYSLSG